jgi:hypothetical protein
MGRLFPLLALADLALLVTALIDCLSVEAHEIRGLARIGWFFFILFLSPIGAIVWFLFGRPARLTEAPTGIWRPAGDPPEEERPPSTLAPDDDPEFLRRLAERTGAPDLAPRSAGSDEDLLRSWEADLRRREEELRRKQRAADEDS